MQDRQDRQENKYWKDLLMWDNITVFYDVEEDINHVSDDTKRTIKCSMNHYVNNVLYEGYIGKNRIDIKPTVRYNTLQHKMVYTTGPTGRQEIDVIKVPIRQIEYTVGGYPTPTPRTYPQDLFNVLPDKMVVDGMTLVKNDFHPV